MTVLTDYALAGVTGCLAWLLFRAREAQVARSYWAAALTALAIGAVLGGTYHGFVSTLAAGTQALLWKATILTVGIGTSAMVAGSVIGTMTGMLRTLLLVVAAGKLIFYASWIVGHDDFIYVIVDSGIAMALVGALHAWTALHGPDRASLWILAGVAISVLAAGVQASGYAPHRNFNHNDLYHVIQIVAMWLLYRGALQLRDCSTLARRT